MIEPYFQSVFGAAPTHVEFTPGRVNLIGEHTDYNGGMVLPTALGLGPTLAISPRHDERIRIASEKFDGIAERQLGVSARSHWSDYVAGAVIVAHEAGLMDGGADIAVQTTLPFGAGLSSSAAIIVGVLKAANTLSKTGLSDTDIAILARRVENDYIGVPCGIMDQMAVAISRPGQALALDTRSLQFDLIDIPSDYHMAVIHSGQHRALSEGRYKIRKEECDAIKAFLGRDDICQISDAELISLSPLPEVLQRRARHCMSEHHRTVKAAQHLAAQEMKAFGQLMIESHASQRDDFEISLPVVDRLVEDAVKFGASGARQTGGGFGGCIVACVKTDELDDWKEALLIHHPDAFFVC